MLGSYTLVFNPHSGGGRGSQVAEKTRLQFNSLGIDLECQATESLEHATELATAAGTQGRIVLACGGDGLIAAVARGCASVDAPMALVPAGRGNDLARALGVPTETQKALQVALDGREDRIDLGMANGSSFCCIASCGFDSDANRIANELPGNGPLDYVKAALQALRAWKPARFTLTCDGVESSFTGYSVIVANTLAYGGGMKIAPDADPRDGRFDVVTIIDGPKLNFLLRFPLVFAGKHTKSPTVDVRRAATVKIAADRPFTLYADGDPLCDLPAVIEVSAAAVRVLLPA